MHDHAPVLAIAELWPLLTALFLTGLTGGFGHCVPMCGPFVMAQVSAKAVGATTPPGYGLSRLTGGALIPYHLGRLTTYSVLGGVVGGASALVVSGTGFRWLLVVVLGVAAALFTLQAIKGIAGWFGVALPGLGAGGMAGGLAGGGAGRFLATPLRGLLANPRGINGYLVGVLLGFLPCGFLYAALTSSAGLGSAMAGAAAMAAFAAGTAPSLILVGMMGHAAGQGLRKALRYATPPLMLVNAAIVARMAWHAAGP